MEFKYNLTKKDSFKVFLKKEGYIGVFFFSLSMAFLLVNVCKFEGTLFTKTVSYIIGALFMALCYLFIVFILAIISFKYSEKKLGSEYGTYTCEITDEKIIDGIGKYKQEVYFKDIKKIIYKKNFIYIIQKHKNVFLYFEKRLFEKPEYFDELEKFLKEKVIITK